MLTFAAVTIAIAAIWYASQVHSTYYKDMKAKNEKIIILQGYIKELREGSENA